MGKITPAPEDILKQSKEENNITTEELVKRYGLPICISTESAAEAIKHGYNNRIFCSIFYENNPCGYDYGVSGMHIVNVTERYFFPKDLPDDLFVNEVFHGILEGN